MKRAYLIGVLLAVSAIVFIGYRAFASQADDANLSINQQGDANPHPIAINQETVINF